MALNFENESKYTVRVREAKLSFGSNDVLSGLNMNIPEGKMYMLLGSSGCGKTTLLNCIIDVLQLDSGKIYKPWVAHSDIGFMPQELALNKHMTIEELFIYFSHVHCLSKEEFMKKVIELSKVLSLPPWENLVGTLSGGEQRRVSLAVTALHDPKFLILDEPTVGQDPVLRQSIWNYLVRTTKVSNKTVLITTHYTEEAKQADIVGMMRKGVMLAEDSPIHLMTRFEDRSLEGVFLQLSDIQNQEEKLPRLQPQDFPLYPTSNHRINSSNGFEGLLEGKITGPTLKKSHLMAEIYKNCWVLWRSKGVLAFQLVVPIFVHFIWQASIGVFSDTVKLAVVNDEMLLSRGNCSRGSNSSLCSESDVFSTYYIDLLKSKFDLYPYETIDNGKEAVTETTVWGLVYFPKNYTHALIERVDNNFNSSDETIDNSTVRVWLDSSNYVLKNYIEDGLKRSLIDYFEKIYKSCQWGKPSFLPFADPIYGTWDLSALENTTPAYIVIMAMYFASSYPTAVIIEEKASNFLKRVSVSGVTSIEIILASLIVNCFLTLLQTAETLIILFAVYQLPCKGNIMNVFILTFSSSIFGILFGILTACLTVSSTVGIMSSIGLASILTILGGLIWPQEGQASVLKFFTWLYPSSYPADSIRSIMIRSLPFSHYRVYFGFLYLIGFNTVLCLLIYLALRHKRALIT